MTKRNKILVGAGIVGALALGVGGVAVASDWGTDDLPVVGNLPVVGDRSDDLTGTVLAEVSDAALAEVPGVVTDAELADDGVHYEVTVRTGDGREFDLILDDGRRVLSSIEDLDD